jgi:hypothetical protein
LQGEEQGDTAVTFDSEYKTVFSFPPNDSEVMTLLILFHLSGMCNLKRFYLFYVCKHLVKEFPGLVSYNRFVEVVLPPVVFLKTCRMGILHLY